MTPFPDEPQDPRDERDELDGPAGDGGATEEYPSPEQPEGEGGVTEEFEAEFGDDFGAEVADELSAKDLGPDEGLGAGQEPEDAGDGEDEDPVPGQPLHGDEGEPEAEQVATGPYNGELDPEWGGEPDGEEGEEPVAGEEDEPQAGEEPDPLEVSSQETVEADVLELADEEEAREAAAREAGEALEARSAAGAARAQDEGEGEPEAGEEPEVEESEAGEEAEVDDGEPEGAEPATAVAAAAPPVEAGGDGPAAAESEPDEPPKAGIWPRFLAASLVIVISIATATSVSILLYLSDIAEGLGGLESVQSQLDSVEGGKSQTILILGSDARPEDPTARSDTTMLLRLDPDQDAITLLSLPRDLKVNIPGSGVGRLNDAYTEGGPKLTVQVVKQLTGLNINHVVNVDFQGFSRAISAIDCVYVDVDRQYFHTNEGLAPEDYFSEIDIKAGYQVLCGERGLAYVRYRHTDNDIVRGARQQDFMREARQKIGPSRLFRDRDQLIKIFTRYTTSDIDDPQTMLQVLKLFLANADAPVHQVSFEGNLGKSYVTASNKQIRTAVKQFLGGEDTPGPRGGAKRKKSGQGKGKKKSGSGGGGGGEAPSLIDSSGEGLAWAEQFGPRVDFPVFYPTELAPGTTISDESRKYRIEDTGGRIKHAYKLVFSMPGTNVPAEYYGLMGLDWLDPPILENPSETREIGGREYDLFYDGDRLRLVAWRTNKAAYWLNNTLLQTLEDNEMLAIARSMRSL